MARKAFRWVYRAVRGLVRRFYPEPHIRGLENLPETPCVIVGNHAQMNGPIVADLYLPGRKVIWCAQEMMRLREVPRYAYRDFWSRKPAISRGFYWALSRLIAPLSVCVFNNAPCIPVYRDARLLTTFRRTLDELEKGTRVVIFPERDAPYNGILCAFQDRFVDLGAMLARRGGGSLAFVPMYVAPRLQSVFLGAPVFYRPGAEPAAERARIVGQLQAAITSMAVAQIPHRVVPYRNIPKRRYPMNEVQNP